MLGSAAAAWTGNAGAGQNAPYRGSGQNNAFSFGQQFGEVLLIESLVRRLGYPDDPLAKASANAVHGATVSVAVNDGGGSPFSVPRQKPAQLPDATRQQLRCFCRSELPFIHFVQNQQSSLFLIVQRDVSSHFARVTFSLDN